MNTCAEIAGKMRNTIRGHNNCLNAGLGRLVQDRRRATNDIRPNHKTLTGWIAGSLELSTQHNSANGPADVKRHLCQPKTDSTSPFFDKRFHTLDSESELESAEKCLRNVGEDVEFGVQSSVSIHYG